MIRSTLLIGRARPPLFLLTRWKGKRCVLRHFFNRLAFCIQCGRRSNGNTATTVLLIARVVLQSVLDDSIEDSRCKDSTKPTTNTHALEELQIVIFTKLGILLRRRSSSVRIANSAIDDGNVERLNLARFYDDRVSDGTLGQCSGFSWTASLYLARLSDQFPLVCFICIQLETFILLLQGINFNVDLVPVGVMCMYVKVGYDNVFTLCLDVEHVPVGPVGIGKGSCMEPRNRTRTSASGCCCRRRCRRRSFCHFSPEVSTIPNTFRKGLSKSPSFPNTCHHGHWARLIHFIFN
mmetsp:Transcript_29614/g.43661  ORF Transcript_29614/g.43661 Transcript_29614/m.43661 type:complete len:293 (-) Transcript_29614:747-1625(-)